MDRSTEPGERRRLTAPPGVLRRHFRLRVWQRFRLSVPAARIGRMEASLRRFADSGLGAPQPTGRLLFVVLWGGRRMGVIYDPDLGAVVTALPAGRPR